MKKTAIGIVALLLALILLGCNGSVSQQKNVGGSVERKEVTVTNKGANDESWLNNIITVDPLGTFDIKKEKIKSVTFLNDMDNVPGNAWNMGKGASSRVKGWVEWDSKMAEVYFAAEGGINGENSCESLFEGCENLIEINFNGAFHTEKAESMAKMFYGCENLEKVDIETLDTSSVTSMYCMFSTCVMIEELDLSNFNTSKVTNMGFMFSACRSLVEVDVTSFDTSKVSNMEGMFRWCESLEYLDVNGWDLRNVNNHSDFMDPGIYYDGKAWENLFE